MPLLPYGTVGQIDPEDYDSRGQSFAESLPSGDTLASCEVTVVTGTCQIAPTRYGTYSSTATAASIVNNEAIVWIKEAVEGNLVLRFRGLSAQGRQIDISETLMVTTR